MINKLFYAILFCVSISLTAQDKKWSVEVNYPISTGTEIANDIPGIVDLGIKYRFLDVGFSRVGVGMNAGVFHDNIRSFDTPESFNFNETNWLFQPKVFMEFQIPSMEKLKPSVGLGYTIIRSEFDGDFLGNELRSSTNGGFNLNFGLSYDLTQRIFVQAQYDYIRYNPESRGNFNIGYLKFGGGFRF